MSRLTVHDGIDVSKDIDCYDIEVANGAKYIHYLAGVYPYEGDSEFGGRVPNYVADEMTFCYVEVADYNFELLNAEAELVQQYTYPLFTAEDVASYVGDAKHLPLTDVNEDTKVGSYWCYLSEE